MNTDEFRRALGGAAWSMDLYAFCDVLGWTVDDYARHKFRDFQELGRLIGLFDPQTLDVLVQRQLQTRAEAPKP